MQGTTLVLILAGMATAAFYLGRSRSLEIAGGPSGISNLHSLPGYYGYYVAIWCLLPALALLFLWLVAEPRVIVALLIKSLPQAQQSLQIGELDLLVNNIRNLAAGDAVSGEIDALLREAAARHTEYTATSRRLLATLCFGLAVLGAAVARRRISPQLRARNRVERVVSILLIAASSIAILTTIGIVFSVLFEAIRFFREVPVSEFLFGLNWSPQTAIRADQVGSSGSFGAVPLFTGTLLITFIAMVVAVPIGLMTAIYLAEYSSSRVRAVAKPLLEILAGIPTVVYGFFAALTVAPALRRAGEFAGVQVASESALAAGLVMGIMIIPLVSSLSDDAINAVPRAMRDGALGLGSTRSEAMRNVILPAALPGIVGGVLLAVSRAIGETMIVVMAAGLAANLTANPFQAVTTVTVQIVTLLVGDQEFDSAKTLAAFALGLVLFVVTLGLNVIGLQVVRKYREQYE
ncbi:MAG: phosphate ABC transporter permease subunit PstC [Gammaproteobacteria bacterium]|nr:phosphate ABC transporter permease subunit PstC [Gammaproteobacteria bacterium]MDH4313579.1 phosphate ABC transporter permease subunit PstC [Gammaproteobacteria bacterium]MDH5212889.1 phosphate ABC transporter permease subunit PstC [Gammaproteobacteria bacterium]